MEDETEFLLRRASEEARQAMRSGQPEVADTHEAMSILYSAKAVTLLSSEDEPTEAAGEPRADTRRRPDR